MDVLTKMENVSRDSNDKPLKEIKILKAVIFVNPFNEITNSTTTEQTPSKTDSESSKTGKWYSNPSENSTPVTDKTGIGKYIGAGTKRSSETKLEEKPSKKPATEYKYDEQRKRQNTDPLKYQKSF